MSELISVLRCASAFGIAIGHTLIMFGSRDIDSRVSKRVDGV